MPARYLRHLAEPQVGHTPTTFQKILAAVTGLVGTLLRGGSPAVVTVTVAPATWVTVTDGPL